VQTPAAVHYKSVDRNCRWLLVGPHVLPHQLTGNHYRDFLLHDVLKLVEDVILAVRTRMWYMHDGAPAHFSLVVWDVPSNTYHDRCVVEEGPTSWHSRSPDANPPDIYPWAHLKLLYIRLQLTMKRHFTTALCLPDYRQPPRRIWAEPAVHGETCIESQGGRFQHLI
jgi:hypothetical protein